MLFVLKSEITEAAERQNDIAIRIINDLCTSIKYGRHSLYAEREVLLSIRNNVFLNPDTRAIASHIFNHFSMKYGDVINHITQYIVFSASQKFISINRAQNGSCEFVLPINSIEDDTIFRESVLLLENSAEKEFYYQLADYYAISNNYRGRFYLESDLGGGDTSSNEFIKHIHNKRICICICDSDIAYPGGSPGNTYTKIKENEDSNWPLCRVVNTFPFREIENLIPIESLKVLSITNGDIRNYLNDFAIIAANSEAFQFYVDVKKGLTIDKLLKLEPSSRSYFEELLISSGLVTKTEITRIHNLTEPQYSNEKNNPLVHCCGNTILSLYLKRIKSLNPSDCTPNQLIVNYHLGALVFNWGFCYGRIVF